MSFIPLLEVGIDQEYIQGISDLTYEEEDSYFVEQLKRLWFQEYPRRPINILEGEQWNTFNGKYFK
jgi:hypothetical protein